MSSPLDHAFDGSFDGAHDSLAEYVADGQAMHVRTVLDLGPVAAEHHSEPPVVAVPDATAAIVADLTAYGD